MFKTLIDWSLKSYSHLPWRQGRTLYTTLVSEIMLQQTTVGTVLSHFRPFLKKYPTVQSLAKTSEEDILKAWKGLGYYRRAKNLRLACIDFEKKFHGEIPLDFEILKTVKGIGEYTASALLSIGADQKFLAIDANVERVLSRIFALKEEKGKKLHQEIQKVIEAKKLKASFRELNEALMDLGREICKAGSTDCQKCPLKRKCLAQKEGKPLEYPFVKEKRKEKFYELKLLRVVIKKQKSILAYQKSEKEWLSGQWELPTFVISSEDKKLTQYPSLNFKVNLEKLPSFKSSITKYRITNYVLEEDENFLKDKKYIFKNLKEINSATSVDKSLRKNREGR